jgi:hypothetical protein
VTRAEHLAWCKQRALEYVERGDRGSLAHAISSMLSDLGKHPETAKSQTIGALIAPIGSTRPDEVRKWIEGFN